MDKPSLPFLRAFLVPYLFLFVLYLLVIGCGGIWLYLTARHAQTELVTTHLVEVVSPFLKQLSKDQEYNKNTIPFLLSQKVIPLYQTMPHLKQVSIRDQQRGYGVRLSSKQQLVDVELEPLQNNFISSINYQQLARQLHLNTSPFFHISINLTSVQGNPIQMDVAFDRAGLVGRINNTLESIILNIVGFIIIGIVSLLLAFAVTLYTAFSAHKMDARLQKIYQQASMGKLSASLVHDLRNPLASLRANIKNLLITPDETEQVVDEMDHDILRLEQKLTDFLSLTKPRHSGFESISIENIINDVVRECKHLFKEKNITLSVLINPDIPVISVIPGDIRDALFNLLVNAKNHTQELGHVWVKTQYNQAQLEIIVEDDGPGIEDAFLKKIFDPFYTTRTNGHGLGLAIVKRTVEAHNGSIIAENCFPSGARFIITLPFTKHE